MPEQEYLDYLYESNSEFVVHKGFSEQREVCPDLQRDIALQSADKILLSMMEFKKKGLCKQVGFNYLEIGVGHGYLYEILSELALVSFGVEPGNWRPSTSHIVSNLSDIPSGIKFDVIVLEDVLEHIADPVNMLIRLNRIANKGCLILGNFPNNDSTIAQSQKGKWRMVRPIGHLHYFSSDSVIKTLNKSKWRILSLRACSYKDRSDDPIEKDQWEFVAKVE